jgi:hypothetical protein
MDVLWSIIRSLSRYLRLRLLDLTDHHDLEKARVPNSV